MVAEGKLLAPLRHARTVVVLMLAVIGWAPPPLRAQSLLDPSLDVLARGSVLRPVLVVALPVAGAVAGVVIAGRRPPCAAGPPAPG